MSNLTPITERFVLHWGEMGTRWGVNRTVAQIHALLFLADHPLNAEEISESLGVARSNVSTSLRELQNWGLVRLVHVKGDRRDHFETSRDVAELARIIVEERKRRELDPTLTMLRQCVLEAGEQPDASPETLQRIQSVLEFMETLTVWIDDMRRLPPSQVMGLLKLGAKIGGLWTGNPPPNPDSQAS